MAPIILPGSASTALVRKICAPIGLEPGCIESQRFSDGETWVKINENIRGRDVYVVQSTHSPANETLMELLLIIDAAKRASAQRVNAVVPYFGYARQDRKDQGRVALSAKLVANLISVAGADRLICLDLHAGQIQGFFDIPFDHLVAGPILAEHVRESGLGLGVVVSPDIGSVRRAGGFAKRMDLPLAIIDKRRPAPNVSEVANIIGDVEGKKVMLFDDIIDTAGTLCNAAEALVESGASEVYACGTHGVLSGSAVERLKASAIKQLIITDTIPQTHNSEQLGEQLTVVSVAPLIGEAIRRIHNHLSVSSLFT
jgi:ribose-phosphate pyrophosphokinase